MSLASNDNFSLTVEAYLAKHHILTYLEDSITQLLECREENPKVVPTQFFCEYFRSLQDGQHTMFREFAYIKSTPHNRISFVVLFWKCFQQIGKKGDLLSMQEYHSLLGLLCPDFPFQMVQNIARIVLIDDALDCLISFSDFIYAFQVQFYFEEFLAKSNEIYQGLLQTINSPRDPVIVPTSNENDGAVHKNTHHPTDGVEAMQFFRAIYPLLNRVEYSTPPLASLKEILFNVPCISFYEFLMAIAKSDSINTYIGRLPSKTELLEGDDVEFRPVSRQQLKTPRKSKQKAKKANEIPVARTSHKVPGGNSQSKVSSGLPWTAALVAADMTSTSNSPSLKPQLGHEKREAALKASSPDTETDSDSTADSSDSN
ncbi:hypothetical protein BsWGS_08354 [Bradybaena similaris]